MTLETVGYIIAIAISVAGFVLAVLKSKPEMLMQEAETSEIFQTMLEKEIKKGIAKDKSIIGMKTRMALLEAELENMCNERDDLKDWADRLVKQIVAAKMTPVKMRRRAT
jgi:hypothetical protein